MTIFNRDSFIDRTARKPSGKKACYFYKYPKVHYPGFRIILDLLALKKEDHYLEIGCGGGVLLKSALEIVTFGGGIDHSKDMVKLSCDNNAQSIKNGRAEIIQGDVTSLPWEDECFSAVASAHMFFFVEQPEQVLAEIFRVLVPGGRFAMVTSAKTLLATINFGWLYKLKSYSNDEMSRMLHTAGFEDINVYTKKFLNQVCFARKPG